MCVLTTQNTRKIVCLHGAHADVRNYTCACSCVHGCAHLYMYGHVYTRVCMCTFKTLNQRGWGDGLLLLMARLNLPSNENYTLKIAEQMWALECSQLLRVKPLAFISSQFGAA